MDWVTTYWKFLAISAVIAGIFTAAAVVIAYAGFGDL